LNNKMDNHDLFDGSNEYKVKGIDSKGKLMWMTLENIKTGEKILPPLFGIVNLIRESKPGYYYAFYYQQHEEYDNIKSRSYYPKPGTKC